MINDTSEHTGPLEARPRARQSTSTNVGRTRALSRVLRPRRTPVCKVQSSLTSAVKKSQYRRHLTTEAFSTLTMSQGATGHSGWRRLQTSRTLLAVRADRSMNGFSRGSPRGARSLHASDSLVDQGARARPMACRRVPPEHGSTLEAELPTDQYR